MLYPRTNPQLTLISPIWLVLNRTFFAEGYSGPNGQPTSQAPPNTAPIPDGGGSGAFIEEGAQADDLFTYFDLADEISHTQDMQRFNGPELSKSLFDVIDQFDSRAASEAAAALEYVPRVVSVEEIGGPMNFGIEGKNFVTHFIKSFLENLTDTTPTQKITYDDGSVLYRLGGPTTGALAEQASLFFPFIKKFPGTVVTEVGAPKTRVGLGLDKHLDDFATSQNGKKVLQLAEDPVNWKKDYYRLLNDPDAEIVFNLKDVDIWSGVSRAASGRGFGATDWELLQIQQNPQWWPRIKWIDDLGNAVPNPFQ